MDTEMLIKSSIKKKLSFSVSHISRLGNGASGSVYRVAFEDGRKPIAVKISQHPELMKQEYEMLSFLKEKTESKIPEVYFYDEADGIAIIAMEYIEGVSGVDKSLKYRFNKKHLAESIIDNLLVIQQSHNNKYGPFDNAVYDAWQ